MDRFEEAFARRLRQELDALDVAPPVRGPQPHMVLPLRLLRPLAVALAAMLLLASLATAATRSTDPMRWVQLGIRAIGISAPSPSPGFNEAQPSPSESAEPTVTPEPSGTDREPSGSTTPEGQQSPEPRDSEGPTRTTSSPSSGGEGADG